MAMVMGGRGRPSRGHATPASPLLPGFFLAVSPAHGPKPFSLVSLPVSLFSYHLIQFIFLLPPWLNYSLTLLPVP